jgi:hypothetical protein
MKETTMRIPPRRFGRRLVTAGALAAAAALAACGGGGDGGGAGSDVPSSALTSPLAFTEYVAAMPPDDRAGVLEIGDDLQPPTSDDEEPMAVD